MSYEGNLNENEYEKKIKNIHRLTLYKMLKNICTSVTPETKLLMTVVNESNNVVVAIGNILQSMQKNKHLSQQDLEIFETSTNNVRKCLCEYANVKMKKFKEFINYFESMRVDIKYIKNQYDALNIDLDDIKKEFDNFTIDKFKNERNPSQVVKNTEQRIIRKSDEAMNKLIDLESKIMREVKNALKLSFIPNIDPAIKKILEED